MFSDVSCAPPTIDGHLHASFTLCNELERAVDLQKRVGALVRMYRIWYIQKGPVLKVIRIGKAAQKVLEAFPVDVIKELRYLLKQLENGHTLTMPCSRPMNTVSLGDHELRLRDKAGIYRIFYYLNFYYLNFYYLNFYYLNFYYLNFYYLNFYYLNFYYLNFYYLNFYYLKMKEKILVLHAFQKKTQETPEQELATARTRLARLLFEENE